MGTLRELFVHLTGQIFVAISVATSIPIWIYLAVKNLDGCFSVDGGRGGGGAIGDFCELLLMPVVISLVSAPIVALAALIAAIYLRRTKPGLYYCLSAVMISLSVFTAAYCFVY